ncbi:MAG: hypothetical protein P8J33_17825 [Pirellulaceae bacterium]|nr:hypothetical protein [Pirellulaceae bacterium]
MLQQLSYRHRLLTGLTFALICACSVGTVEAQGMVPVAPKPSGTQGTYTQVANQNAQPAIVPSGNQGTTQSSNAWRAVPPSGAGYQAAANPAGFYQQPVFDGFSTQPAPTFGMINTGYGAPQYQMAQVPQQYQQAAPVYVPQSYVAPGTQPYMGQVPGQYGASTFQPLWTAQLNYLYMTRKNSSSVPLLLDNTGATKYNADQLDYGWKGGWDVALSRRTGPNSNFELRYFQLRDWSASAEVDVAAGDRIATTPVSFLAVPGPATMSYLADTKLNSFEFNFVNRGATASRFRFAIGFRWIEVSENLAQTYTTGSIETTTLEIDTNNHLYGLQLASDGVLFNTGCFSVAAWVKGGAYANWGDQATTFSNIAGDTLIYSSLDRTTPSFMGETGLIADWSIFPSVSLVAGYQILYIAGLALAPDQLQNMSSIGTGLTPIVLDQSDAFYHGALLGVDVHW